MRFAFYTHSLVSDWNHGNAHFLRGVMRDLLARGHEAFALEPENGWSRTNLLAEQGVAAVEKFRAFFPELVSETYGDDFDHAAALEGVDVVVVHEWTAPEIVAEIGRLRLAGGTFTLLFHDTHHRRVSDADSIERLALDGYDGVLAFGKSLRERYLDAGWGREVFTWHEAADDILFKPLSERKTGDLIWIGNWGDGERSEELRELLIRPAKMLGLSGEVRGVRYPREGLAALAETGLTYRGWIANADAPRAFARHKVTVHIPRRPYVEALSGIPTIRVFEALACGIPLVSAHWEDSEHLFRPGEDFLIAHDQTEMVQHLREVLRDPALAESLSQSGLERIRERHTCRHRVDELLSILERLGARPQQTQEAAE